MKIDFVQNGREVRVILVINHLSEKSGRSQYVFPSCQAEDCDQNFGQKDGLRNFSLGLPLGR